MNEPKLYYTPRQVEDHYGLDYQTLANWRRVGRGPAFHQIGRRIRYSVDDIEAWFASHRKKTFEAKE